jgi:hypothetical protein
MPDRTVAELRQQANRCSRLATSITADRARAVLKKMADDLEREAKLLEERLGVERSGEDNPEPTDEEPKLQAKTNGK